MSTRLGLALSSFLLFAPSLVLNTAWAQNEADLDAPFESDEQSGDEVDLVEEDTPVEDGNYDFDSPASDVTGGSENPVAARSTFTEGDQEATPKAKAQDGYPIRAIERPLNLPGSMSQLTLSMPLFVDPVAAGATLHATYGILDNIQLGLSYSLGAVSSDGFDVGKAVAVGGQYLLTEYLALQVAIPVFLDPLAVGLVLGAPMKFTFFDSFSLIFGQDLLAIKLHEFSPSLTDARQNAAYIGDLSDGTLTPDWRINATLGVLYQVNDTHAFDVQFGTHFDDSESATTTQLDAGMLHVHSRSIDFGARIGATDLSSFTESFSLNLLLNLRI